jgi:hypothetical protein
MLVLFVCLLVYSRTSNFSAIWRLSPLPVSGLQILPYARRSGPLSREGSLSCHTYCDTGPQFIRSHRKDRHLHPTVGFEPPTQRSSDHCARRSNHCATQAASIIIIDYDLLLWLWSVRKNVCGCYLEEPCFALEKKMKTSVQCNIQG